MAHVSNFTQAGDKIVLDMINDDNDSFFTLGTVSVVRGTDAPVTKNSTAKVAALPGSGYSGDTHVEYDRLQLQDFVDLYFPDDGLLLQLGDAESVIDFLPEINTALSINLVEGVDVADQAIEAWEGIPNETKTITVPVLASSLVYLGSIEFTLDGNDIPLADVITVKVLSGLNLPVV